MQDEVEGRRQSKRRRSATCIGQVSSVLAPGRLPARGVAIEKEIQTVLNGTHRELVQATRKAEAKRAAAIAAAEKWRNDCISSIEHEFNGAIKQARHQFEEDQRLVQERLIDETKRKKRRVIDTQAQERRRLNTAGNGSKPLQRSSVFALRSSRSMGEVALFKAGSFRCRLNASEIRADIQAMERPFKERPRKQSLPPTIRHSNGVLLFRKLRFRVGDSVMIQENDGEKDPIVGLLKTISDVEVVFTADNGNSRSVFLAELRADRYQLQRAKSRSSEGERDSSPSGSSRS